MDLSSLVEELKRQKENSFDIIAEDDDIASIPEEHLGLMIGILNRGMWPLTEGAHSQLADKLGIPKKYYDRMREAKKFKLLAHNINAWLHGERKKEILKYFKSSQFLNILIP